MALYDGLKHRLRDELDILERKFTSEAYLDEEDLRKADLILHSLYCLSAYESRELKELPEGTIIYPKSAAYEYDPHEDIRF